MKIPCRLFTKGCKGAEICSTGFCAGVDEAGRGPLAGPVVAAAVILRPEDINRIENLKDSKKLSPQQRGKIFKQIISSAIAWKVATIGPRTIEVINIHNASILAMKKAVLKLRPFPQGLLIDGKFDLEGIHIPQQAIIRGDFFCPFISAASIIAKIFRDRIMIKYHQLYPQYGFDRNKGYPTVEHREAIQRYGPCPIHRRNFKGIYA